MQSKRDQVQAHMFVMGRLTSGMLRADPDAPESPQGRTNRGVALSIVIAVLLAAGSFVFGLLKPGTKDSWRDEGTLVVNKDTGGRYLYLDGRLRPVRNYTSARLLLGADMETASVGSKSLGGTAHGAPVGIPGAPDDLPGGSALTTGPWQVCSATGVTGTTSTALVVGTDLGGDGLAGSEGLLVTGPDKAQYLVWQGSKLRLDVAGGAREALGYGSRTSRPVSAALLNSLSSGPDLAAPAVERRGDAGPSIGGADTRIGQVFQVSAPGGDLHYYVLRKEGLAPVNATMAALLLGNPETKKAYAGGTVAATTLGAAAVIGHLAPGTEGGETRTDMPASPPKAVEPGVGTSPCVSIQSGADGTRVSVSLARTEEIGRPAQATTEGLTAACVTVNRIVVPPGGGALVHALGADGSNVGSTVYLVTDNGVKYRVPSDDALKALGYTASQAQRLPSSLLSMVPTGPDLTASAAASGRVRATAPPCGEGAARTAEGAAKAADGGKVKAAAGGEVKAAGD
ncbi:MULTISPECIES: type VII secretion protein EccB [Streptomyces]|uniref:Type VII secretion protein EccB n=1 Tax=Streptomyces doudnae TaxID=3075536 RepID=A0ABD5ELC1_9ACTN|nr:MULTISPECIES: type VII secretion protein EccB [unclassified Streptomyces]MDT0435451.1 type VII secretion protein EccB [Streptomyces sp. DSM 41981]MYQ63960.1 type VII secretion protein EccB [Streptomyces sp. SID4950]SCD69006.1 type VII secretion protein EccB [Streptomyces sp. SolWspMP-5a-2]